MRTTPVQYFHGGVGAGPVLISRQDGSVLEERRYEPFGAPIDAYREWPGGSAELGDIDHVGEPLNVLNKLTEAHTGWSDHGARWMAPETARWLTPDPPVKGPEPHFLSSPWDLHPYQYVRQNPMLYWDPDGRFGRLDLPSVALAEACKGRCSTADKQAFQSSYEYTLKEGLLALNPIPTSKEELALQVATGGSGKAIVKLAKVASAVRHQQRVVNAARRTADIAATGLGESRNAIARAIQWRARQLAGFGTQGTPVILDENIARRGAAEALRDAGFNVRTVREVFGRGDVPDSDILRFAESIDARVLTMDRGRQLDGGFFGRAIQVDGRAAGTASLIRVLESSLK
ncbi:DUF5615 family PIN-like protein [Myxococcus sp. AM001]|nr:DUF5615 family PIN-like protein [Myxococcus sp. AM001]